MAAAHHVERALVRQQAERRQRQRRLAGARLADHAQRAAGRHRELGALHRDEFALAEPALDAGWAPGSHAQAPGRITGGSPARASSTSRCGRLSISLRV
jgi:hypothetical protein